MAEFRKRIYTLPNMAQDVGLAVKSLRNVNRLHREGSGRRIPRAFGEKIMLAVTQVNGCRYCAYAHSRWALRAGVSGGEVRNLLSGELGEFSNMELPALLFAQHYAESGGAPDIQARNCLEQAYGSHGAEEILAYIRMIMIGNLYGNTVDALLARLAGNGAPASSLWNELLVILGIVVIGPLAAGKALIESE